jgi:cyclophilin family peptidyl-prolyl cis-trans isomerase
VNLAGVAGGCFLPRTHFGVPGREEKQLALESTGRMRFPVCIPAAPAAVAVQTDLNQGEPTMKRILFLAAFAVALAAPLRAAAKNPVVVMETSQGTIKIELDEEKAPVTVKNFLSYVDDKFYDGTIFHRVMPGFMIQGGGFQDNKEKGTKAPIKSEASNGLANKRGTIAMARTDNPNSATAQFFINHRDNPSLSPGGVDRFGYAVFGKVIEGMDVVDKIASVRTGSRVMEAKGGIRAPFENVPKDDVVIKSVRRADN